MGCIVKVCVTGHRGYLGTAVVAELRAHGHDVTGLDADLYGAITPLEVPDARFPQRADIAWIRRDIRDATAQDFQGFDAVIHLAGLSNDPLGALDPALTHAINDDAAYRVAAAAKQAGVPRFVFASSCSVYGASDDQLLDEQTAFAPVTAYAQSKAQAERAIAELADAQFCPSFLRSGTVYGATAMMRFDLVVNNLSAWALASGDIRLKSDGRAWRPIVHVCDVARAFRLMLAAPIADIRNAAFNVAVEGGNMQIIEIAQRIEAARPACNITFAKEADADRRNYRVCGKKLEGLLGDHWWAHAFDAGLRDLIDVLNPLGLSVAQFEGAGFQRLAHLQEQRARGALSPTLRRQEHADP